MDITVPPQAESQPVGNQGKRNSVDSSGAASTAIGTDGVYGTQSTHSISSLPATSSSSSQASSKLSALVRVKAPPIGGIISSGDIAPSTTKSTSSPGHSQSIKKEDSTGSTPPPPPLTNSEGLGNLTNSVSSSRGSGGSTPPPPPLSQLPSKDSQVSGSPSQQSSQQVSPSRSQTSGVTPGALMNLSHQDIPSSDEDIEIVIGKFGEVKSKSISRISGTPSSQIALSRAGSSSLGTPHPGSARGGSIGGEIDPLTGSSGVGGAYTSSGFPAPSASTTTSLSRVAAGSDRKNSGTHTPTGYTSNWRDQPQSQGGYSASSGYNSKYERTERAPSGSPVSGINSMVSGGTPVAASANGAGGSVSSTASASKEQQGSKDGSKNGSKDVSRDTGNDWSGKDDWSGKGEWKDYSEYKSWNSSKDYSNKDYNQSGQSGSGSKDYNSTNHNQVPASKESLSAISEGSKEGRSSTEAGRKQGSSARKPTPIEAAFAQALEIEERRASRNSQNVASSPEQQPSNSPNANGGVGTTPAVSSKSSKKEKKASKNESKGETGSGTNGETTATTGATTAGTTGTTGGVTAGTVGANGETTVTAVAGDPAEDEGNVTDEEALQAAYNRWAGVSDHPWWHVPDELLPHEQLVHATSSNVGAGLAGDHEINVHHEEMGGDSVPLDLNGEGSDEGLDGVDGAMRGVSVGSRKSGRLGALGQQQLAASLNIGLVSSSSATGAAESSGSGDKKKKDRLSRTGDKNKDGKTEGVVTIPAGASLQRSQSAADKAEEEKISSEWDSRAKSYIDEHMSTKLTMEEVDEKIIEPLQDVADELGLKGQMKLFGSFMSGFAGVKSDLDVTFIWRPGAQDQKSPHDILTKLAALLEKSGKYDSIVKVLHAQSPLIRCTHAELKVEVEVLLNNQLGVQNSHLLHCYSKVDYRVAYLVRIVKTWAKAYDVLGSQDGCINSYAYVLLVLNYLITINFLPNLQLLAIAMGIDKKCVKLKKWGTPDIVDTRFWSADVPNCRPDELGELTLHQLTANFFQFYLNFPWETGAVCIRQQLPGDEPGMIQKKSLYQWDHSPCPQWYIEDPFDVKHNLSGRTSENGRKRIIEAMEKALAKLNNFDEAFQVNRKPRHWLKASISSTVTPQQVYECFKDHGLIHLYVPKYETFFLQTGEDGRTPYFGAPRYKNIMLEFSDQQHLRLAESSKNETFLCESQLRLHKTTTGFVESETQTESGSAGGYYSFNVGGLSPEKLAKELQKAMVEREKDISSPKFSSGKGKGKSKPVPGTEAYYAAIGGDEAAEAASYSQPYSSAEDVSSPQDARDGRGGTPGTEREAVDWTQQWLASKAAQDTDSTNPKPTSGTLIGPGGVLYGTSASTPLMYAGHPGAHPGSLGPGSGAIIGPGGQLYATGPGGVAVRKGAIPVAGVGGVNGVAGVNGGVMGAGGLVKGPGGYPVSLMKGGGGLPSAFQLKGEMLAAKGAAAEAHAKGDEAGEAYWSAVAKGKTEILQKGRVTGCVVAKGKTEILQKGISPDKKDGTNPALWKGKGMIHFAPGGRPVMPAGAVPVPGGVLLAKGMPPGAAGAGAFVPGAMGGTAGMGVGMGGTAGMGVAGMGGAGMSGAHFDAEMMRAKGGMAFYGGGHDPSMMMAKGGYFMHPGGGMMKGHPGMMYNPQHAAAMAAHQHAASQHAASQHAASQHAASQHAASQHAAAASAAAAASGNTPGSAAAAAAASGTSGRAVENGTSASGTRASAEAYNPSGSGGTATPGNSRWGGGGAYYYGAGNVGNVTKGGGGRNGEGMHGGGSASSSAAGVEPWSSPGNYERS